MRSETVKHIVKYYGGIPEAIKLLKRERDALEDEYNGLGGLAMDGMPHSSAPGNPTEALAVRVIENGVKNRLQEIGVQVEVLEGDAANIRGALDAVNGKYKSVIIMRLIRGYSWTKISGKLGVPDSTARNWHGRAVERLGEVLEEVPMVDELAERATRAYIICAGKNPVKNAHAPAGFFACKNLSFGAGNTAGKLAEKVFWSKDFTRRAEPFPLIGKSRRKNNLRIGGVRRESRAGF